MSRIRKLIEYFRWRDDVMGRDNYDAYIEDDRERRRELGVTDDDERQWQAQKDTEPLPF
jgi:hypothetical protein